MAGSYEVLARKWRPQRFEEVVGQEHVTQTLANAIRADRVAHAYLFSGLRGSGKTTTARILAKALNCVKGPTPAPCGECVNCQEIARGTSLDCLEIDGASNRGIEEIRSLRERIGFAPVGGKNKVYIIDEVHMLTGEAFNALLKTLEEPPAHAVFIFATTHPRKVPATILSRCQRFHFRRIPAATIESHLAKVAKAEKLGVEPDALALVSRRADGSLRDAESLLEQLSSLREGKVTAADCREFLGVTDDEVYFQAGRALFDGDGHALMVLLEELVRQGGEPAEFAEGLTGHLRHLMVASLDPESPALSDLAADDLRRYREEAARVAGCDLLGTLEKVSALGPELRRSAQPRLQLEVGLLGLTRPAAEREPRDEGGGPEPRPRAAAAPKSAPPASPRKPARRAEEENPGAPAPAFAAPPPAEIAAPPPAPASAPPPAEHPAPAYAWEVGLDAVQEVWIRFVGEVQRQRRTLGAFLATGAPAAMEGQRLVIGFPAAEKFSMREVERPENRQFLAGVLGEIVGQKLGVVCRAVGEPAREGDSSVRRFLEAFDGEIIKE